MSRKQKKPDSPPSKAYLVSFGDTMTALLAFFIVLNSLAKDQTGAKMHAGTGSFMNAIKSIGVSGDYAGNRSANLMNRTAPTPIYAVANNDPSQNSRDNKGPDQENDLQRVRDRRSDDFQRFLNEMQRQFVIEEDAPIRHQVVLDIWEKLGGEPSNILGPNAIHVASDAIGQLENPQTRIELVIWADMPSPHSMKKSIDRAEAARNQIQRLFHLNENQEQRMKFSSKPWLFVDAKRPIASFVISQMADP